MGIGTYFAIYFIMWWICLFLVLPFSGKTQLEAGEVTLGTVKSAPADLNVMRIVIMNTIVASLFFGVFFFVVEVLGLEFSDVMDFFPRF